jgi:chaperonin GroES
MEFSGGVVETAAAKADQVALMSAVAKNRPIVSVDPLKIKPLDCRILARTLPQSEKTAGGIIVPNGVDKQRQLTMLEVIKVGDGRTTDHGVHIKVRVKAGDIVIVGKFAGSPVGQSEEYKIINEVEILGVQEQ